MDTVRKSPDLQIGIDIQGLFDHHIKLGTSEVTGFSAILAVQVGRLEDVEIRQVKATDPQTGKGHQVFPANATQSGNGHGGIQQSILLGRCQETDIARQRFFQIMVFVLVPQRAKLADMG